MIAPFGRRSIFFLTVSASRLVSAACSIGTTRALRDAEHCLDKFFTALGWFRDCWHRHANIWRYFSVAKNIRSPYVLRLEARVLESDGLSYKQ